MKTLKIHTRTDKQGRVTIDVDTALPDSELDLIVQFEDQPWPSNVSENKQEYDLSEFVGAMKWNIDPLEYQIKMRDKS